ncbi:hypothetical protein BDR26DRAFT_873738 [Obelidium mucronatum]|nr:hypothetical protein BDR26DRAFT_873738 [Obelidium mucronatum]
MQGVLPTTLHPFSFGNFNPQDYGIEPDSIDTFATPTTSTATHVPHTPNSPKRVAQSPRSLSSTSISSSTSSYNSYTSESSISPPQQPNDSQKQTASPLQNKLESKALSQKLEQLLLLQQQFPSSASLRRLTSQHSFVNLPVVGASVSNSNNNPPPAVTVTEMNSTESPEQDSQQQQSIFQHIITSITRRSSVITHQHQQPSPPTISRTTSSKSMILTSEPSSINPPRNSSTSLFRKQRRKRRIRSDSEAERSSSRSSSSNGSTDSADSNTSSENSETKRSIWEEALFFSGLVVHQIRILTGGIFDYAREGVGRPTWNGKLHVTLHWLRNQLSYSSHSIQRAREITSQFREKDLNAHPKGSCLVVVHFRVRRIELLRFEAEALRIAQKFRFPIPAEVDESGEPVLYTDYCLEGEWLVKERRELGDGGDVKVGVTRKVILFIHGGAYCLGDTVRSRSFVARIMMETGYDVFAINYRLAPEAPFPAGLHDCLAAYLYLTNPNHCTFDSPCPETNTPRHTAIPPENIVLMGDSAGGGLCMALLTYLKCYLRTAATGEPMIALPGAVVLFSPWIDLSYRNESWKENANVDWLPNRVVSLHDPIIPKSAENPNGVDNPVYMYILGNSKQRILPLPSTDRRRSMTPLSIAPSNAVLLGISTNSPKQQRNQLKKKKLLEQDTLRQQQQQIQHEQQRHKDKRQHQPSHLLFPGSTHSSSSNSSVASSTTPSPLLTRKMLEQEDSRIKSVIEIMITHPLISPVYNNEYSGMPPLLILTGDAEVLRDESILLAKKYTYSNVMAREAEKANAATLDLDDGGLAELPKLPEKLKRTSLVRHEMYRDMVHVWVLLGWLPQAKLAVSNAGKFLRHLEQGDTVCDYASEDDGVQVNVHLTKS